MKMFPAIIIFASGMIWASCAQDRDETSQSKQTDMKLTTAKTNEIVFSSYRHDTLSTQQLERIKVIQKALAERYPITFEEWVDGFRRDMHPEYEIRTWEMIARAYMAYIAGKDYSPEKQNEVYLVLLQRSMMPMESVLQYVKLKNISTKEAIEAMELYTLDPAPPIAERIK